MNVDLRTRVERLEQAVADLQAKEDLRDKAEVKEEKKPARARKLHEKPEE